MGLNLRVENFSGWNVLQTNSYLFARAVDMLDEKLFQQLLVYIY